MIIANPIYDVVFKRMMENDRVAKFFIGTLLNQTIESVEVKPQEFTYVDELAGLAVFRLDFIATIKAEDGEYKKVLIEIQKAKNEIDLMRFRNYLAEQYKKEDTINDEKVILPITTIYILGFKLPEIELPCVQVGRYYKNSLNDEIINAKSDFIEKLTHDSYVVQVDRITGGYSTKLEKLLSLFEQQHFVDDKKIIKEFKHDLDNEDIKVATEILHYAGTDPASRKNIEVEQEAWRSVNAMFEDQRKALVKKLNEKEQVINEKEQVINEKEQVINEKEQVINEKEQVITKQEQLLDELLKEMEILKQKLQDK
jgi:hypothetical protein